MAPTYIGTASGVNTPVLSPLTPLAVPLLVKPRCLAGLFHATARGATIRGHLIGVAARISRHGRGEITLHLPEGWHREQDWMNLFEAACGPPARRPDRPAQAMAHRPGRTGHPSLIPGPESQQDKPHSKVSGSNATPGKRIKIIMAKRQPLNDQPDLNGGSRVSRGTHRHHRARRSPPMLSDPPDASAGFPGPSCAHGRRSCIRPWPRETLTKPPVS